MTLTNFRQSDIVRTSRYRPDNFRQSGGHQNIDAGCFRRGARAGDIAVGLLPGWVLRLGEDDLEMG